LEDVTKVVAGPDANHFCVIRDVGTDVGALFCWGPNGDGQLGNGEIDEVAHPEPILILDSGVTDVALSFEHSCAVKDGDAFCWGSNEDGQIGDGLVCGEVCPAPVLVLDGGVTAVAAGEDHSCAVQGGFVMCWGGNLRGQLGDGTTTTRTSPVDVCATGFTDCAVNPLGGIVSIAAGGYYQGSAALDPFTCALTEMGTVKCWGLNGFGQLGAASNEICSTIACSTTPLDADVPPGATSLAVGSSHVCAVTSASVSNGVRCWGYNETGMLGDGTNTTRVTPVDVCFSTEPPTMGSPCDDGLLNGVSSVTAGYYHTCALMIDGTVRCWGFDDAGQLGDGTLTLRAPYRGYPQSVSPVTVLIDTDRDGCSDNAERGSDPSAGGLRDPDNYWDYFNPGQDGINRVPDITAVVEHFGQDANVQGSSYDVRYDRTPLAGAPQWQFGPPNGSIRVADISAAVNSFGHDCGYY
jgi:alpha-tubulin suppressor-like RCC1 family protein